MAAANAGVSGRTPPSPWIGSAMMAAVDRETAGQQRRGSLTGTNRTPGQQRLERRAVVLVGSHRQRAERPAVKRVLERDELGARLAARVPVAPGELEARFDGLGAAVAEKRARQARELREALGQLSLQRVEEQIRGVQQRLRLVGDGARQPWVRMAERRDADARQQVEILASLRVEQADALAAHERDRLTSVRLQHVPRFARLNSSMVIVSISSQQVEVLRYIRQSRLPV